MTPEKKALIAKRFNCHDGILATFVDGTYFATPEAGPELEELSNAAKVALNELPPERGGLEMKVTKLNYRVIAERMPGNVYFVVILAMGAPVTKSIRRLIRRAEKMFAGSAPVPPAPAAPRTLNDSRERPAVAPTPSSEFRGEY